MSQLVGTGGVAPELRARPRLLVVDDDVIALRTLERILKREGFEVQTARTIDDAKKLITEEQFDGALIDEILDGGSGSSLVSELRTAESPCCAVMITGSSRTEAARRALAAGAEGFLLKPVQDDMLMDSLRRTVERTRQWRAQVDGVEWDNDFPAPPHLWVVAPVPTDSVPKGPKLVAWPPLRTLGALDIERCADAIAEIGGLTDRERRILVPLLRGEQNPEIARSAGVTARTVKFHVSNILKKLRLTARAEIVRFFF